MRRSTPTSSRQRRRARDGRAAWVGIAIVAEGAWPSAEGQAYCRQPGIATAAQVAGWRKVTDAVHARGGCIVLQVMHGGRIGSHHIKGEGVATVAPSAIRAAGEVFTEDNLTTKRPGDGISPMRWHEVLGQTAKRDFAEDEKIEV